MISKAIIPQEKLLMQLSKALDVYETRNEKLEPSMVLLLHSQPLTGGCSAL
jgi:hypothetical protein